MDDMPRNVVKMFTPEQAEATRKGREQEIAKIVHEASKNIERQMNDDEKNELIHLLSSIEQEAEAREERQKNIAKIVLEESKQLEKQMSDDEKNELIHLLNNIEQEASARKIRQEEIEKIVLEESKKLEMQMHDSDKSELIHLLNNIKERADDPIAVKRYFTLVEKFIARQKDYYNRNDIMVLFDCKQDKAHRLMKYMQQSGFAMKNGNQVVISKENLSKFIDEVYNGKDLKL